MAGSPYDIVASGAVGTGLGNYTITYQAGELTVEPEGVEDDGRTTGRKTYGDAVTFAGTEFTTSGLINGDAVSSVTLTSAGAAATATVAGSPYDIVASGAVGTGLATTRSPTRPATLTVDPEGVDDHGRPTGRKTYGDAVTFAGTEFTHQRTDQRRRGEQRDAHQRRGGGHGDGGRLALRHRGQRARWARGWATTRSPIRPAS